MCGFAWCGGMLLNFGFVVLIFPDKAPGTAVYLVPECQDLVFCKPKGCFKKTLFSGSCRLD